MDNKSEEEIILTMEDVLRSQFLIEQQANQTLSQTGEDKCTYEDGYITQDVFACRTCQNEGKQQFGFCIGCSLRCHLEHDIFELFSKRHFRCDCGIPLTTTTNNNYGGGGGGGGGKCCLLEPKGHHSKNIENKYNHNFSGLYCWCNSEYNEDTDNDVMYKCVICEDWFHKSCITANQPSFQFPTLHPLLSTPTPTSTSTLTSTSPSTTTPQINNNDNNNNDNDNNDKAEGEGEGDEEYDFICSDCCSLNTYLLHYYKHDITTFQHTDFNLLPPRLIIAPSSPSSSPPFCKLQSFLSYLHPHNNDDDNNNNNKSENEEEINKEKNKVNIYFKKDWKRYLCRCNECISLYQSLNYLPLDDDDDDDDNINININTKDEDEHVNGNNNISPHPHLPSQPSPSPSRSSSSTKRNITSLSSPSSPNDTNLYSLSMNAFETTFTNQTQQRNILYAFNNLSTQLRQYFAPFAQSHRTVTSDDIYQFFDELKAKKRKFDDNDDNDNNNDNL